MDTGTLWNGVQYGSVGYCFSVLQRNSHCNERLFGGDEEEELLSISITRHETVGYSLFSNKCLQGYGPSCTVSFYTAARLGRGCVCVHGQ